MRAVSKLVKMSKRMNSWVTASIILTGIVSVGIVLAIPFFVFY